MLLFNIDKDEGTQSFSLENIPRQNNSQDYNYGNNEQKRQVQQMEIEIQNAQNVQDNHTEQSIDNAQRNQNNMTQEVDEEKIKQEKFNKKEKEFLAEQLKEKRMCMKVHFKNKQISDITKLIEQNQLTLQYYEQKKYLQPTDVNFSRSLLEEYCSLRDKINKSNETLRQLEMKKWDSNTLVQNLRDLQKQEESISAYKIQEYTKEQKQTEIKRIEDFKEQIKKINDDIEKLKEKHIQNSDNYSTIKLQLKEQNTKNEQLKAEIDNLRRNN